MCQILKKVFYLRMVQEEDGDTLDPLTISYGGGGSLEVDGRFCISISIVSSLSEIQIIDLYMMKQAGNIIKGISTAKIVLMVSTCQFHDNFFFLFSDF